MSGSNKARVERRDFKIGAVATPDQEKALLLIRERERTESKLRLANDEVARLKAEVAAALAVGEVCAATIADLKRERDEAIESQRARSLACSEACERAARELAAARAECEAMRDKLGVSRVALDGASGAVATLSARVDGLELRLADVLSPLRGLGPSGPVLEEAGSAKSDAERWSLAWAEVAKAEALARGSPTEGDCQSPPAHTLGARGGP